MTRFLFALVVVGSLMSCEPSQQQPIGSISDPSATTIDPQQTTFGSGNAWAADGSSSGNSSSAAPPFVLGTFAIFADQSSGNTSGSNDSSASQVFKNQGVVNDTTLSIARKGNGYVAKYGVAGSYQMEFPFELNKPQNITAQGAQVQYIYKLEQGGITADNTTLSVEMISPNGSFTRFVVFDKRGVNVTFKLGDQDQYLYYKRILPDLVIGLYELDNQGSANQSQPGGSGSQAALAESGSQSGFSQDFGSGWRACLSSLEPRTFQRLEDYVKSIPLTVGLNDTLAPFNDAQQVLIYCDHGFCYEKLIVDANKFILLPFNLDIPSETVLPGGKTLKFTATLEEGTSGRVVLRKDVELSGFPKKVPFESVFDASGLTILRNDLTGKRFYRRVQRQSPDNSRDSSMQLQSAQQPSQSAATDAPLSSTVSSTTSTPSSTQSAFSSEGNSQGQYTTTDQPDFTSGSQQGTTSETTTTRRRSRMTPRRPRSRPGSFVRLTTEAPNQDGGPDDKPSVEFDEDQDQSPDQDQGGDQFKAAMRELRVEPLVYSLKLRLPIQLRVPQQPEVEINVL